MIYKQRLNVKIVSLILSFFIIVVTGCAKQKTISEKEFSVIWKEYLKREFEESFDEKQSFAQREMILKELLEKYELGLESFKSYMMKEHKEKYKKIFLK